MRKILKTLWFSGRINRFEYLISVIVIFGVIIPIGNSNLANQEIYSFPLIYLYLTQGVKRLHDRGIYSFFILNPANFIFNCTEKGDPDINRYGEADSWYQEKLLPFLHQAAFYFTKIYRISLSRQKQENLVWKDLKKYHTNSVWHSGIFEKEKYIHTSFEISDYILRDYYYMLYNGYYTCTVRIIEDFPQELTTDLFVLATHFNNLLEKGIVIINVKENCIEYSLKINYLVPLLSTGEIDTNVLTHYKTSKDIFWAFQKMIDENEAPAIIMADLMKMISTANESET